MRANIILLNRADWQRAALRRLDRAQDVANRWGIGRDTIRAAYGHRYLPASVSSVRPGLTDLYDLVALLDLSDRAQVAIPLSVRAELLELFAEVKEPRPPWLSADDVWPH